MNSEDGKSRSRTQLSPAMPGYSDDEAKELIGMCVAANNLGPVTFAPFPIGLVPADDPTNPLPNDDGKTYPFPCHPIWPAGWTPAVPADNKGKPWEKSVLTSRLPNGAGVNGAIISYNSERDAYAIAFAGTLNPGAAMQDLSALLIPAGPVDLGFFKSDEVYTSQYPDSPVEPAGGQIGDPLPEPPEQIPRVHLGYRNAVEMLTIDPGMPLNFKSILQQLSGDVVNLYVTGHSLGAAVAQLFSAWIKAGGVPSKTIHVKCYSFATPKSTNLPMASNYNRALGNDGFSFRVDNSLDTAPQLPPTTEVATDLINPVIASSLGGDAKPNGLYAASPLVPIVEMILKEKDSDGSPDEPPTKQPAPAFPFSVLCDAVSAVAKLALPAEPAPVQNPPPKKEPTQPMNFIGMGSPFILSAQPPVVYNGVAYPPEFFPARKSDDLVKIPDETTRQWWQHWPYNYAKYIAAHAETKKSF